MTATDKCKAILYYSFANNLFNTPSFVTQATKKNAFYVTDVNDEWVGEKHKKNNYFVHQFWCYIFFQYFSFLLLTDVVA